MHVIHILIHILYVKIFSQSGAKITSMGRKNLIDVENAAGMGQLVKRIFFLSTKNWLKYI